MLHLLLRRRALTVKNALLSLDAGDWLKTSLFVGVGVALLVGVYAGFARVLRFLETVQLVGPLLTWKLTGIALLTTFWMVAISNLIAAMTTLYYAYDLGFLHVSPAPPRTIFLDKSIETAVYASWMVALTLIPFVLALGRAKGAGIGFYLACAGLTVPFLALAAFIGVLLTLLLMYFFPSSRTRDVVWVLSSGSVALVYVVVRFAQPEQLIRPDLLERVADYLRYLQAPTAPYLPSWWLTRGLEAWLAGKWSLFAREALYLYGACAAATGLLLALAERMYATGLSGAQEGRRSGRRWTLEPFLEEDAVRRLGLRSSVPFLYWKERTTFFRDVRHWSQLMLIAALMAVYVFSIWKLPLDTPELKSLGAFFNIASAGFVLAALGLRFTYPAVSMEGRSLWLIKSAPVTAREVMVSKLLFSAVPMAFLGGGVVLASNWLLGADAFASRVALATTLLCAFTLSGMGVGFGAIFPKFNVENIHQIESSAGGFVYMACGLGYIGATIAVEAVMMQYHFLMRFGKIGGWDKQLLMFTAAGMLILNLIAFLVPWELGRRSLEAYEGETA